MADAQLGEQRIDGSQPHIVVLAALPWAALQAQELQSPTGWEARGLPAINFDADEGFGYGALLQLYNYGVEGYAPYLLTIQPTVFLTTGGRREFTVFFDAPHLLPNGWRIDASVGSERQLAVPYYGLGNESVWDEALEETEGKFYYRFGRTRRRLSVNLQRNLGASPIRVLAGLGATHTTVNTHPEEADRTLLAGELAGAAPPEGWSNRIRAGLVWDTRDRETGPRRGTWSDVLVAVVPEFLGSQSSYVRWTVTDRRYVPLGERVTLANRIILQNVEGDAPFYNLYSIQGSFKGMEGLGGSKSLRGIPWNRYVGEGVFLWNAEVRWRVRGFRMMNRGFQLILSGFVDSGRVWENGLELDEVLSDLHTSYGAGVRVGMGENFVVSWDVGHSSGAAAPTYINLGYLF